MKPIGIQRRAPLTAVPMTSTATSRMKVVARRGSVAWRSRWKSKREKTTSAISPMSA